MTATVSQRPAARRRRVDRPDVWLWVLLPTLAVLGLIFGQQLADLISFSVHEMTGPAPTIWRARPRAGAAWRCSW